MKKLLYYALCAALLTLVVLWRVSIWDECRNTNSASYCWAVTSK